MLVATGIVLNYHIVSDYSTEFQILPLFLLSIIIIITIHHSNFRKLRLQYSKSFCQKLMIKF